MTNISKEPSQSRKTSQPKPPKKKHGQIILPTGMQDFEKYLPRDKWGSYCVIDGQQLETPWGKVQVCIRGESVEFRFLEKGYASS
jgi:hypothetical protein